MKFLIMIILLAGLSAAQTTKEWAAAEAGHLKIPATLDSFKTFPHLSPFNQDTTSSCWSFSTLSFLESEMARQGVAPVRLAVMYPVYWGFVEKAARYIETKGASHFAPGDLFTGVLKTIEKYGIVPQQVYHGQSLPGVYNHKELYAALDKYLAEIKKIKNWDREEGVEKITEILDHYLGRPPTRFDFKGKSYTPQSFLKDYCHIRPDDYRMYTSFSYAPFGGEVTLDVPDNWARIAEYRNLPLDQFYGNLIKALKRGYSAAIDADISEPGRLPEQDVCFIPTFDYPAAAIDQKAREFRFKNGSTTDDHLMHIVGYTRYADSDWFLVKDSWRNAWEGRYKGYFLMRGDYVKLKVLAYVLHKEALND